MEKEMHCSFGSVNGAIPCSATEFSQVSAYGVEEQELLMLRSSISIRPNSTICEKHESRLLRMFELHQKKRCNPFRNHKKAITSGLSSISLNECKHWQTVGYHLIPGSKLCKTCRKTLNKPLNEESDQEDQQQDPDFQLNESEIDKSLLELGISPVKKHGKSEHHQKSDAKRKLKKVEDNLQNFKESILGSPKFNNEKEKKEVMEKAKGFDEIVNAIKGKIETSDKRTVTQLLTLAPQSMTLKKVMSTFNVTEYQAKKSKKLFKEKVVLAIPPLYKGKLLTKNVLDGVAAFYENDEYSRSMPGKKDFVSIGKNNHKQKRLILSNLKELFQSFKTQHPNIQIGYSKFCSLRPKWCILPGASGTHSVCVCTYHQNTKLLVEALGSGITYKDLLGKLVCSTENKECMLGRCENCPGQDPLRNYLQEFFGDYDEDHQIIFTQWSNTDRATLSKMVSDVPSFIDRLIESLEELSPHSFISKAQSRYLNQLKENLDFSSAIFLGDFAENFSFVVQDEIQSFHWNNAMCTLHPVVIYYRTAENSISHFSYTIISDDNTHDVHFVYKVINIIIKDLKEKLPQLNLLYFFTDGCAGQYKNRKTLYNLCQIKDEYGIDAQWNFFATSHGKSPCDGIGGTVKRLTALESLARPYSDQILSAEEMFKFCERQIPSVIFKFLSKDEMAQLRFLHADRYTAIESAIPGTRSYHQFKPFSRDKIGAKRCSDDTQYACIHNFNTSFCFDEEIVEGSYIAVVYDQNWWLGLIIENNKEQHDVTVKFLHPKGPSKFYHWPHRDDICYIPNNSILKVIEAPTTTGTGRNYSIPENDENAIIQKFTNFLKI